MNQGLKMFGWLVGCCLTLVVTARGEDLMVTSLAEYAGQTNIQVQATGSIHFSGGHLQLPPLPPNAVTGLLSVQAGKDIFFAADTYIEAGPGWSLSFVAGGNMTFGTGSSLMTGDAGAAISIQTGGQIVNSGNYLSSSNAGTVVILTGIQTTTNTSIIPSSFQLIQLYSQVNPTNLTVATGANLLFISVAASETPFDRQWFKNGAALPGETNVYFSLTNLHRADAGSYSIVGSNNLGSVTNNVQLRVLAPQKLALNANPDHQHMTLSCHDTDDESPAGPDTADLILQTSTNLVDWITVCVPGFTNSNGDRSFQLPMTSVSDRKFFRVVSQ